MNTILKLGHNFGATCVLSAVCWIVTYSIDVIAVAPTETVENAENAILSDGSVLELIYTRKAKLNSGLTEGPAVAADGSIYFTDMPFGTDNGMILRFDPKTKQTTVFTDNSGKSNGLAFLRDGSAVSCDGAGIKVVDPSGNELAFVETGPRNQKGLFDDWKGIPSNVEFGIGDDAHSLYVTIDKSLYRLKVKTHGFHPHLESK